MSRSAVVMPGQVKVEVQSPVKPDVLKPSNAANLQNIPTKTPKALSISAKDTTVGRTVLGSNKNVIGKVSLKIQQQVNGNPRSSSLRSSPSSARSPHKSLTPIRPSPTVKLSTSASRSPSSPYVRTPTSVSRVAAPSSGVGLGSSGISTPSPAKCRRRISYSDGGSDVPLPVSRRNARERNRVKMVSQGFAILRQHVPHAARKKKLSKVETLRCAVEYIRGLQLLLDNHPTVVVSSSSPPTSSSSHHPPAIHSDPHHHHHHHLHHLHQGVMGPTSSSSPSNANALSSTAASYQQLHPQVFLHPHHGIEPHILKLPTAEDTYQSIGQMRYDGPDGAFLRTSPCDSSDISPTNSFYEQKFTPPGTGTVTLATTTTSPTASTISSSSSTSSSSSSTSPSSGLPLGVIKTEENEDMRNYGREEQDLLEALAWWQHNIN